MCYFYSSLCSIFWSTYNFVCSPFCSLCSLFLLYFLFLFNIFFSDHFFFFSALCFTLPSIPLFLVNLRVKGSDSKVCCFLILQSKNELIRIYSTTILYMCNMKKSWQNEIYIHSFVHSFYSFLFSILSSPSLFTQLFSDLPCCFLFKSAIFSF